MILFNKSVRRRDFYFDEQITAEAKGGGMPSNFKNNDIIFKL